MYRLFHAAPSKVVPLRFDAVTPVFAPLLTIRKYYFELGMCNLRFFLNHDFVIKSCSGQCQHGFTCTSRKQSNGSPAEEPIHPRVRRRPAKSVPVWCACIFFFELCIMNLFLRVKLWIDISIHMFYEVCWKMCGENDLVGGALVIGCSIKTVLPLSLLCLCRNFWTKTARLWPRILHAPQIWHLVTLFFPPKNPSWH